MGSDWEVHLESFYFPLEQFKKENGVVDFSKLKEIKLIFDQCTKGVVAIDEIGFL